MNLATDAAFPDVTRADAGTILVSPWIVGTPQRQHAAINATLAEWTHAPLPQGFLSLSCFASTDGRTVLNYAQWTSDGAHLAFMQTARPALVREIDAVVPGIERPGVTRYRLDRSVVPKDQPRRTPTAMIAVTFDVDNAAVQRTLIDSLVTTGPALTDPHPGLIAAHFHASIDGRRVLNYSEWTDIAAHADFLASATSARTRAIVETIPGVALFGFTRYRLHGSLAAPASRILAQKTE